MIGFCVAMILSISGADGCTVDVIAEPGDTLTSLSAEHGLEDWRRIYDATLDLENPDQIAVGQVLTIPAENVELERRDLPEPPPPPVSSPQSSRSSTTSTSSSTPRVSRSSPSPPASPSGSVWDRLAQCESGGNWSINTGNGYYGGLQFLPATWRSVGGTGLPHEHSRAEQIKRAEILLSRSGWGQWPFCSRKLGLR